MYPYNNFSHGGVLRGLRKFNFNNFIDGAQKTLSVANQIVPLIYQVGPIIGNMKTLFKISSVINEEDSSKEKDNDDVINTNKPIFYI